MIRVLTILLIYLVISNNCFARDRLRIVGSSTLYPFVTVVAERFAKNSHFKTPIVESTGTGGGINLLCLGNDLKFPDIVSASRKIKKSELKRCSDNEVKNVEEILIGYDGIVIASSIYSHNYFFNIKDLFLALAKKIPHEGKIVDNFYTYWSQINSSFPKNKIEIYGPSFTSGTRETLVELVMVKYCINLPEFIAQYPKKEERMNVCKLIRKDGVFIDIGENDNFTIHKIETNTTSLGIIGYNFLLENKQKVKASKISGIEPSLESVLNKTYPLARELYLYVNNDHTKIIPGSYEFIHEFKSNSAISKYGYLTLKGFIPALPN